MRQEILKATTCTSAWLHCHQRKGDVFKRSLAITGKNSLTPEQVEFLWQETECSISCEISASFFDLQEKHKPGTEKIK